MISERATMNGSPLGIPLTADSIGDDLRPFILIVEDDDIQAGIMASSLERSGFGVDTADRGLGALSKMWETIYDVVLIDYQLPEFDGIATARLIRDFMGPVARPILVAFSVTPEVVNARANEKENPFDLVLGKSSGLSPLLAFIRHNLALIADIDARRAIASARLDQAQLNHWSGPRRSGADGENPGPVRILVVEDDETQRLLLASVMRKRGYSVETATNGLEAVHKIHNECFDLILVDYKIPEIDGLAVAKLTHLLIDDAIRPRLIALTVAFSTLQAKEAGTDVVFDKVIEKSSDFDGLMRAVDGVMKRSPSPATKRAAGSFTRVENSA